MINTVGLKGWETTIPSPFPPDPSTNSVCVVSVLILQLSSLVAPMDQTFQNPFLPWQAIEPQPLADGVHCTALQRQDCSTSLS